MKQQNINDSTHSTAMNELTPKACGLALGLALIFAASNAYLGLKIGVVVSASIPAAVISMVLFRALGQVKILEVNIVQTGASAASSLATGIVFILPATILIGYWADLYYWQAVLICIAGGVLGILLSIPMRRTLLSHRELKFPEGVAIATMLQTTQRKSASVRELIMGGLIGGLLQFCQQGFQWVASDWQLWFALPNNIIGFSLGFDATMFGAGYIIGLNVCLSILLGATVGWVFGVPALSLFYPWSSHAPLAQQVMAMWSAHGRYIGVGALLAAGVWSLIVCLKPIIIALSYSFETLKNIGKTDLPQVPRTEQDIPGWMVLSGIIVLTLVCTLFVFHHFHLSGLGFSSWLSASFLLVTLVFILIASFVFSAICAYFSGLVGMTASPISSINIAIVLLFSMLLVGYIHYTLIQETPAQILHAAGIVILVTTIVGTAASMANGNIQDLKTGQLIGATPWKLQLMLILGVVVSTLVAPLIISMLYHTYGIADAFPASVHDHSQALAAPQATILATLSRGVFLGHLPYSMISIGIVMVLVLIAIKMICPKQFEWFSILGFGFGVYLPMMITFPIILGGVMAGFIAWRHQRQREQQAAPQQALALTQQLESSSHRATLIATGLIAGGSLMGVVLAIPFALTGNLNLFVIAPSYFAPFANILGLISLLALCYWIYHAAIPASRR